MAKLVRPVFADITSAGGVCGMHRRRRPSPRSRHCRDRPPPARTGQFVEGPVSLSADLSAKRIASHADAQCKPGILGTPSASSAAAATSPFASYARSGSSTAVGLNGVAIVRRESSPAFLRERRRRRSWAAARCIPHPPQLIRIRPRRPRARHRLAPPHENRCADVIGLDWHPARRTTFSSNLACYHTIFKLLSVLDASPSTSSTSAATSSQHPSTPFPHPSNINHSAPTHQRHQVFRLAASSCSCFSATEPTNLGPTRCVLPAYSFVYRKFKAFSD